MDYQAICQIGINAKEIEGASDKQIVSYLIHQTKSAVRTTQALNKFEDVTISDFEDDIKAIRCASDGHLLGGVKDYLVLQHTPFIVSDGMTLTLIAPKGYFDTKASVAEPDLASSNREKPDYFLVGNA